MILKKIAALGLTLALCATLSTAAFATSEGSPSVGSPSVGSPSVGDVVVPEEDNNDDTTIPGEGTGDDTAASGDGSVKVETGRPSIGTVVYNTVAAETEDGEIVSVFKSTVSQEERAAFLQALPTYNGQGYAAQYYVDLMVRTEEGELKDGALSAAATVDLKKIFPDIDFASKTVDYLLLHYNSVTGQVEAEEIDENGFVTLDALCPVWLMTREVKAETPSGGTTPTVTVTTTTTTATTAVSPKTGEPAIAAVLGLMAMTSGAGVVLTRKKK